MKRLFLVAVLLAGGTALAHEGVKNPEVMARMEGMKSIGEHTKTLGLMAKGTTEFDPDTARLAAQELAQEAARIEGLFEPQASDPKSEALPVIWSQFPDFVEQAEALETLAKNSTDLQTHGDLKDAMRKIGANCSGCHKAYRKP